VVDIWEYANPGTPLRIECIDGQIFEGWTNYVADVDEQMGASDEDLLTIDLKNGGMMAFNPSEITKIERIAE